MNTASNRRPAFLHRPWIAGGLYDKYAAMTVLHMDARVLWITGLHVNVLTIDLTLGGRKPLAADAYYIEPDGLTPLWRNDWALASTVPVYWTAANDAWMARVHRTVVNEAERMATGPSWSTCTLQAHYVHVPDSDPMRGVRNAYTPRRPYAPRKPKTNNFPPGIL